MPGRVLIGPNPLRRFEPAFRPILEAVGLEVVWPRRHGQMTEAELRDQLPGCVASLAGSEPYTPDILKLAKDAGLKCIGRAGVGYDGIDVAAATALGIPVTYAPGTNHEAVGELALGLILAVAKQIVQQDAAVRRGEWPRQAYRPLRGTTLGIVGLGRTGQATARRARAFDMTVIATDPVWDAAFADANGVRRVLLGELLAEADFVSLHVPLAPDTRNLVRAETIAGMKPTAVLVNTSRGPVVHESDLFAALRDGRLAGAGLDVFTDEPPGVGHPLLSLPTVVATAHTAGVDSRSIADMGRVAAEGVVAVLRGERPPADRLVNPEVWGRV